MKLKLSLLILLATLSSAAVGQKSEFAIGRNYYLEGEFKKAAVHFELALEASPYDAESHHWAGKSYRVLAEIAAPFNHKYNGRARVHLTRAMELAPDRPEYRKELFDFLLDSASRADNRQAAGILRTVSQSDPEFTWMHWQFEQASRANSSVDARLGRLFLAVPGTFDRIGDLPAFLSRPKDDRN